MAERIMQELELSSGFTIGVTALPPYYMDMLNDQYPIPEYPMRKLTLKGGDEVPWPYEPPEEAPTEDDEDYELFVKWHATHRQIKEANELRSTARVNYLLLMTVEILDGPIDFENIESWAYKITTAFPDFEVPEDIGQRKLLFLKHFILTTPQELNFVVSSATAPEVSMQGLTSALSGFRNLVEEGRFGEDNIEELQEQLDSLDEIMGSGSSTSSGEDS